MDFDKLSKRYARQSILLTTGLALLGLLVANVYQTSGIIIPLVVSSLFVLVTEVASAFLWRWVAVKHSDMLPSFFTGVSGFRFLLALVVMFVWYLATNRQEIITFFVVFLIFYFVSLIHHSIFFSRVSNRL
jgi:F0F1-type ATP synthase assembly protein I